MVMHSSDGTFCKTLDRGVELWLLDPHTEPGLSHAPSGSPAGPPVFVAAVKDGKIVGKVIYLPVPIQLNQGNVPGAICMDLEILPGFRGLKLFRAMLAVGEKACLDGSIFQLHFLLAPVVLLHRRFSHCTRGFFAVLANHGFR